MSATIEMVSFKLASGSDEQAFLATNAALESWVAQQPGFQYRALTKQPDNTWIDIVFWCSLEDAQQAGNAFMSAQEPKAMLAFIDKETVNMQHLPVLAARACTEIEAA